MNENTQQGFFYIIPAQLAESGNPTKALLYGLITSLANKDGYCWASSSFLGDKLKVKERIIRKYVSELQKDGYIITETTNNARKIYISYPQVIHRVGTTVPGGRHLNAGGVGTTVPHSNIKSNIKEYSIFKKKKDYLITLHDGTKAVNVFGVWKDPVSGAIINPSYYKEITKL